MAATSLLISESPLTVQPSLAVLLGLNEAIFLQQVQYWITREAGFCDQYGRRWIYNTVKQWRDQFPFWSESTIKRTIRSLEEQHALLSTTVGDAFNKTKAYTINSDRIEELNQKIVHEQMRASVEGVQRRVSAPPPKGGVWEYTEEQAVSDDAEAQHKSPTATGLDMEGQKIKTGEPLEEVKMTQHTVQNEPLEEVNLTRSNRPAETPTAARFCTSSSRTRVTETTTTENTHKIRETTTDDVRSLCTSLGISGTSLARFIRRYGASSVHEKARLLETAMQTQSIRNPAGWLHAALKNGYTFSHPHPLTSEESVQSKSMTERSGKTAPSSGFPAICSDDSKEVAADDAKTKKKREVPQILQDYLDRQKGDGGDFAREFLRWRGNEGRASPSP